MKTQLFTFLSFVLSFAVLGEVKVQKAPLKSLLIDNASVVTDVTGTDAAKRLEAEGGRSWIDGDGRIYRVGRRASFRGLSAVSADDPDGTVQWSFDYPGAEYCDLSYDPPSRWYLSYGRMEDVENDGVIWQEEVQYVYKGTAPWSASSVTMKREHYNDEFVLSLAFVTNAADRLATTGEVARIASGISGGLTTNDVCAIVTNTLPGGWSEWRKNPGWKDPPDTRNAELVPAWDNVWDFRYEDYWNGEWIPSVGNYVEIDEGQTRVDAFTGCWFERECIPGGNALGLAMAKDVEKKFAEATNAIPSIVTNEVAVIGDWVVTTNGAYAPGWRIDIMELPGADTPVFDVSLLDHEGSPIVILDTIGTPDPTATCYSGRIMEDVGGYGYLGIAYTAERKRITRNALGLARIKDIEKLPTHETVTNVARSVVNSVWDASLGVAWEARMHNGHLYYIAVTNRPPEGK